MNMEAPFLILLIAIPTFFVLRWVLKRFIKDNKNRNVASVVGAILLAPVLYLIFVFAFFSYLFYEPQYDFDRERWFDDKYSRYEMRDDMVESKIFIGKNKSEVIDFIGEPESNVSTDVWVYDLGTSGAGLGFQLNSLQIIFQNEKVSEVKKIEVID